MNLHSLGLGSTQPSDLSPLNFFMRPFLRKQKEYRRGYF